MLERHGEGVGKMAVGLGMMHEGRGKLGGNADADAGGEGREGGLCKG